jgi:hypothetical protein
MCIVVNKYKSPFDVYIGRGSLWGNPYVIDKDGDRAEVIRKYRLLLWQQIQDGEVTIDQLKSLNGKRLGCFCKPKPCHGDVIASAVVWALEQE